MNKHYFSYKETGFFSKLILDYLDQKMPDDLYRNYLDINTIENQIFEKKNQVINRELLFDVIKSQNAQIVLSDVSVNNLELIRDESTFTVTTGHQLCLFGGPLYFIYKIISTINLTEIFKKKYPKYNFIPIFWMASEDHDFAEINHVNLFGKKYIWDTQQSGMVGDFQTNNIDSLINEIFDSVSPTMYSSELKDLLIKCYRDNTLAFSTRRLINEFFGKYGILVLDPSDSRLKQEFIPVMKRDIVNNESYELIKRQSNRLSENYKVQAHVRKINFFKLSKNKRERIVKDINEREIDLSPENFSPNVLMRPLYQEMILPNLVYVGGPAEISYWMQLKTAFKSMNIVFPILALRNSVIIMESSDYQIWQNANLDFKEIFSPLSIIEKRIVSHFSPDSFITDEKLSLLTIYNRILQKTDDNNLKAFIESNFSSHKKDIDYIEKKIIKSKKLDHQRLIKKVSRIKNKLFPANSLQDRYDCFIHLYLIHGKRFIEILKEEIDPLNLNFLLLSIKDSEYDS